MFQFKNILGLFHNKIIGGAVAISFQNILDVCRNKICCIAVGVTADKEVAIFQNQHYVRRYPRFIRIQFSPELSKLASWKTCEKVQLYFAHYAEKRGHSALVEMKMCMDNLSPITRRNFLRFIELATASLNTHKSPGPHPHGSGRTV